LIRGLAVMPSVVGTAQSASLAGPAPTSVASDLQAKLSLAPIPPAPGRPEPEVATTPAAKALETTSTLASAVARNQPTFSGAEIAALLARGDWLFATGDVASARLLYERAAAVGEARAALKLGETFDPPFLSRLKLRGVRADSDMAVFWYRRARNLGASDADSRLIRLGAKKGELP
jgi:TPR repeat protein